MIMSISCGSLNLGSANCNSFDVVQLSMSIRLEVKLLVSFWRFDVVILWCWMLCDAESSTLRTWNFSPLISSGMMAVCRKTSSWDFSWVAAPVHQHLSSVFTFADVCCVAMSVFYRFLLLTMKKSVVILFTFFASRSRTILISMSRLKTVESQLFHFDQLRSVFGDRFLRLSHM